MLKAITLDPVQGRTFIIGDIHGCAEELKQLLDTFNVTSKDNIIAVGDLINGGPDSSMVLQLAREFKIQPILGNHEIRLLNAFQTKDISTLKANDLPTFDILEPADWEWIAQWPHVVALNHYNTLVTHGGFLPEIPWFEQSPEVVTNIQVINSKGEPARRSKEPNAKPWADFWKGPQRVFYGHTPRPAPQINSHAIGLDTGCVYGHDLTAFTLPQDSFISVKARKAYRS